jgi:glycosyltransferase involved in cell wall biosynthesis
MIITTIHTTFFNGNIYEAPGHTLNETLKYYKKNFIFIRHSMNGVQPSTIFEYRNGELVKSKKLWVFSKIALLRYVTEIISTFTYFLLQKNSNYRVYIGVDPLNALTGILLKKIGKFKKVVFYAVDFSEQRFNNIILNWFYKNIYKFCAKNADQVWSASTRILKVIEKFNFKRIENIFVPNIPSDYCINYINNIKQKYHLITLGLIDDHIDFIGIFNTISELKDNFPMLILKIIGNGPKEQEYRSYINANDLNANIIFLGYLDHNQALKEISKSGIGLALYNGKWNFNYYGDSMKCREYFRVGLPVITTDTHSTAEEIKEFNAGIVCELGKENYKKAILDILQNYEQYSDNSYKLGQRYKNLHKYLLRNI